MPLLTTTPASTLRLRRTETQLSYAVLLPVFRAVVSIPAEIAPPWVSWRVSAGAASVGVRIAVCPGFVARALVSGVC